MLRIAIVLPLLAGLTLAQDEPQESKDLWIQDFAAAKAQAKAEKKDLLVDFTGSDWCGWCIRLDNEVFSKDEFISSAPKDFVLVKLDYPRDQSILTEEIIAQNKKLQSEYGIQGYPTILLMDHDGRVYAQTGYQKGGPGPYNEMLGDAKKKGKAFQTALASAADKQGVEKAKALEAALSTLEEPVAETYHLAIMKQIVELDADGSAGLKEKYGDKVKQIEETKMANEAAQELNQLIGAHMQAGEGDKAIAALDAVIKDPKNPLRHQMALFFKGMVIMDTSGDADQAIACLEAAKALKPDSSISERIEAVIPQIKKQAEGDGGK